MNKMMHKNRMPWKAYGYVYKMRILKMLAYKFDVYGNIIMQCIIMFASAFFWKALYGAEGKVQGVGVDTMLVYTVVSAMMSVLFMTGVEQRVLQSVEKGTVATDMLKPVSLFGIYFFEDLGTVTALVFQNILPIFLIGSMCIAIPLPVSPNLSGLFCLSLSMAFFINWLLAACFSMWAFTAINMDPLIQVKKHLLRLLSGSIIPMWFFPEWMERLLNLLPFVYIYQLPLDIYINKHSQEILLGKMIMQFLWVVILLVLFLYLQKRTVKKVLVQGG